MMQITYELNAEDWNVIFTHYSTEIVRRRFPMGIGVVVRWLLTTTAMILLVPGCILVLGLAGVWLTPRVGNSTDRFMLALVVTAAYAEAVLLTCCIATLCWKRLERGPWLGFPRGKRWIERTAQRVVRLRVHRAIQDGTITLGWGYRFSVDETGIAEIAELDEHGAVRRTETRVPWPCVEQVDATERHILVSAGKMRLFLVPRRAFQTAAAYREFVSAIRQLRSTARPTGITATLPKPTSEAAEIQGKPQKTL